MLSAFPEAAESVLLGSEMTFGAILMASRTRRAVLVSLKFSGSSWLTVPNQTGL